MKTFLSKTKAYAMAIIVILLMSISSQAVEVTFRVDMSEEVVSPAGVHIAGSFQGWAPGTTLMTKSPFGQVYFYTHDFAVGDTIEFKYVNGDSWGQDETVPAHCAQNGNRYLTIPAEDIILNVVCYERCIVCNPPLVEITFQVDMSNQQVSPNGVHVTGTFQGWDPAANEMLPIGDNIYALTLPLGAGEYIEYKFVNGNSWGSDETVPGTCAIGNNRFLVLPTFATTLPAVCFGSCDPCSGPTVDVEVTFLVDMSQQIISPDGVHIGGGFQGWNPATTLMSDAGNGIYTYTAILQSSSYQEYKFVNGDEWAEAEIVPAECSFVNNRFFTTPEADTVLDMVCFGMCIACPEPAEVEITFQVDMSLEEVSPDGVHLAGTFNGFNTSATTMEPQGEGIYAATLTLTEGDYEMYKFVNGNTFAGFELVPAECSQEDGNRELIVPGDTTSLAVVCFGSCTSCIPPPTADVEFLVDMSNEEVSPDSVHLAGSFNGFSTDATPMTDIGDNVYSATVNLLVGEHITYKFINGNTFDGVESVPAECGEDDTFGGYNRFFDVQEEGNILPLVCFSSCEECTTPVYVEVSFLVDMQNEMVSPEGVFIAGSFQGWNTTTDPMTLVEDQIYTFTATLEVGEYYEYKFLNGDSTLNYETIPAACATMGGNRYLTAPETNSTLSLVCFGSCTACVPPVDVEVSFQVDMSNEIISGEGVYIAGTFNGFSADATPMLAMGDDMYAVTLTLTAGESYLYKYLNGPNFDNPETVPGQCGIPDGFGGFNRSLLVVAPQMTLEPVCFGSCTACQNQSHQIMLLEGWNSLSSYLLPLDTNIVTLMSQIDEDLILMQTMTDVYYPAGGINTILHWASPSAYKIKVSADVTLNIVGTPEPNKTVVLQAGWNLIPVISESPISVQDLFAPVIDKLTVVKDVAETGVFWPAFNINTLGTLQAGKAYFVRMEQTGEITFP